MKRHIPINVTWWHDGWNYTVESVQFLHEPSSYYSPEVWDLDIHLGTRHHEDNPNAVWHVSSGQLPDEIWDQLVTEVWRRAFSDECA